MQGEVTLIVTGGLILVTSLCGGMLLIGSALSDMWWRRETVKRKFAYYDQQTGKWKWLND